MTDTYRSRRPRRPPKPTPPKIFEYEVVTLRDQSPSGWAGSGLGRINGPITLDGLLDLIPQDVGLEEVFIDPTTEYESAQAEIYVRKATLIPDAEKKLERYRKAMADWEQLMLEHKDALTKWVQEGPAAMRKESVEAKRSELEKLELRRAQLDEEIREAAFIEREKTHAKI